jgi:signal peptidase II
VRSVLARCALLVGITVALDRLTKLLFMRLPDPEPFWFSRVLTLTHHKNTGLIADFPLPQAAILTLTVAILLLVVIGLRRALHKNDLQRSLALSLVVAGAVGNLWDRIAWGFVFDWILLFETSIINLADITITLGIAWYLLAPTKNAENTSLDEVPKTP